MDVNPLLVVLFLMMVVFIVYRYLEETFSLLERLNIPGPKPKWIFGNAKSFQNRSPLDVFMEWKKIYGKVYGYYEGFRAGIVINDPELAKLILNKQFENFHMRAPYRPFLYYPSNLSLVNLDGDHWKTQRSMLTKVLVFGNNFQQVIKTLKRRAMAFTDYLEAERKRSKDSFNISAMVNRYTTETMLSVVLSMEEGDWSKHIDSMLEYLEASKMSAAADNPLCGLARLFPALRPFLQLFDRKHKRLHGRMIELLRHYLQKTAKAENNNDEESEENESVLSKLLDCKVMMRDNYGTHTKRKLKEDEIIAHVLALYSETFETTSGTLMFVLYELAVNPDVQDKLYREISELNDNQEDDMSYSHLQSLSYLDMVINETLRLHPIAPGLARMCVCDCEIDGIHFKKGMPVRIMTCTVYKDGDYFPNPEFFDPERFSEDAKQNRHSYTFLPFGQGPRQCPGIKLGLIEVKLAIMAVLRRYTLHRNENTEVPLKTALRPSLCPANGVNITLKER